MSRKTLVKTVLIIIAAPFLASIMVFLIGSMGLASGFLTLVGIGSMAEEKTDRIIFVNESSSQISSLMLSTGLADGSKVVSLEGEEVTIDWESWPCELAAVDADGQTVAQLRITEDPYEAMERDEWFVIARDGQQGVTFTLSHIRDLEKVLDWGSEHSGLELSGGTIQKFIYRHDGWLGDGDSLLVISFTPEQGAELEQSMAKTNGWHPFPTHELLDKIFFVEHSYCRDLNDENYVPAVKDGWYFFRDMFNVQHGDDDENQWELDGRVNLPGNFDAGIYDSDSHILYLFEFDS